jgi:hypothetical protein
MLLVMLCTLLMFAIQEVLSTTFASRDHHTQHGALLHLRGAGASSRLYIHDGVTAGSRCHMNTNLVESPEWKVLRDAVSLYVSAAAADRNANPKSGSIEAAEKLISNHLRIMLDVTNPFAKSQRHLSRLPISDLNMIDRLLLEIVRRLLVKQPNGPALARLLPEHHAEAKVWSMVLSFLDKRLQSTDEELPGRKPDMSPSASQAFRAVLEEMSSLEAIASC